MNEPQINFGHIKHVGYDCIYVTETNKERRFNSPLSYMSSSSGGVPLWCCFILFTCFLCNQLSQSSGAPWSEYKAIKVIQESDPIQVDPS